MGAASLLLLAAALVAPRLHCPAEDPPLPGSPALHALADAANRGSLARRLAWRRGTRRVERGRATPCELVRPDGPWRAPLTDVGWSTLLDDAFTAYEPDAPWNPTEPVGPWTTLWRGCAGPCDEELGEGVRVGPSTGPDDDPLRVLSLRPSPPEHPQMTRSTFVATTEVAAGALLLEASLRTDSQLRDVPNPWETAWLFWRLAEDGDDRAKAADPSSLCGGRHGLYLALKTNGWELGKFGPGYSQGLTGDPAAGGCQRFLASGEAPAAVPGQWQQVCVLAVDGHFAAWVDGEPLVGAGSWLDRDDRGSRGDRPEGEGLYVSGGVGLYTEDAAVSFADVRLFAQP